MAPSCYCPDLFCQSVLLKAETRIDTGAGVWVADPHHLYEDPDQAFHLNADPDPGFLFNADPGSILSLRGSILSL